MSSAAGSSSSETRMSVVLGIRAHAGNPWLLPRLGQWSAHYDPCPEIIVADMGSSGSHGREVQAICEREGYRHLRIEDDGTYSQSIARNAGALAANTDLVFFCDVDCIGPSDLFARLARHAEAIDLCRCFDQLVVLPVYHLESEASESLASAPASNRSALLERYFVDAVHAPRGSVAELVDPFSNVLLCHVDFFRLVGGYDRSFRGHGSEDFELMIRCALHSGHLPLPGRISEDLRGPTDPGFWGIRPYEGFRRLGEATATQAELAGIRMAHLAHPRVRGGDSWYDANDWRRERFAQKMQRNLRGWAGLLQSDGFDAARRASVVVREDWEASVLLPLRWRGLTLELVEAGTETTHPDQRPLYFVQTHAADRGGPIVERARDAGQTIIRVERGTSDLLWHLDGPSEPPTRYIGSRADGFRVVSHPEASDRDFERAQIERPLSRTSYAAARVGVAVHSSDGVQEVIPTELEHWLPRSVREEPPTKRAWRKLRKLLRDPKAFLQDSVLGGRRS